MMVAGEAIGAVAISATNDADRFGAGMFREATQPHQDRHDKFPASTGRSGPIATPALLSQRHGVLEG